MTSRVTSLLTSHLGIPAHVAGLIVTRVFRSITMTYHHVRSPAWQWGPPRSAAHRSAVVLFPSESATVPVADTSVPESTAIGLYLPPGAEQTLDWERDTELLAIWLPEPLLQEFAEGETPDSALLYPSPLTIGFRTFALAVVRHGDEGSSMSQYAVERLLAEMTFGALLEQQSAENAQRPSSLVEHARSIMLMHRENPQFSIPQLAADLHVSSRQLQRAFARVGVTPRVMLRRMRVELAESLLSNPLYSDLTIEEVARYTGFTSGLQLRRALHAEGAPTPSELRHRVGHPSD